MAHAFGTAVLFLAWCLPAGATPFIWDDNDNRIDDRVETVNALGYPFAFEQGDTLLRQRIQVVQTPSLVYSVYVIFEHDPTPADLLTLQMLGMPVLHRYVSVPAVRSVATYSQIQQAAALDAVERVEAVPVLYPMDRIGTAAIGAKDPSNQVFPTTSLAGAPSGEGIVVAILDTGVNDAPSGTYPGHESLLGKCLGGAAFLGGDSTADTPMDGSINPVDRGNSVTGAHGTHVAGIILGTGGLSGYVPGVAPAARFIDVKVITDAGIGTALPEALDWCIVNRGRAWGADPTYNGIDVINMSLSSVDQSDGNDMASRLAERAVELGISVVASTGNDGDVGHIPSPASADGVLAVAAYDDQRTPLDIDDYFTTMSNSGPRASDQDADAADEQKPDLIAPGVGVLSANGELTSGGADYQRKTGTSMAAAYVSGAVAVLRSAFPSYTPGQIADLLRATALRTIPGPASTGGVDPRWRSTIGFGGVDLYAAWLEGQQPGHSQVRRLTLTSTDLEIGARLWTQREMGATHFVFERAGDEADAPGAFAPIDSVPATGDGSLLDDNLQEYARTWAVPEAERGAPFWYRVSYTEAGARWNSPATRFLQPQGPAAATLEITIVHNAYDNDIDATVLAGTGYDSKTHTMTGTQFALPGSGSAYSSDWVSGTSTTGNVAWTFHVDIPAGVADAWLPPSTAQPWWLRVTEGGFLNRSGRVQSYKLVWHAPGGDITYIGGPTPQQTLEGHATYASIPQGLVGVASPHAAGGLRVGPNPVAAGNAVQFVSRGPIADDLHVFDLAGREVGRAPFVASGSGTFVARWATRDLAGQPLGSGLYFVRAGAGAGSRLVVVAH